MTEGSRSGAGNLHGSSGPGFDPMQYYVWKDRQMHNGLVVVTWQLVDHPVGSGGLVWQLFDNLPRHFLQPILTCVRWWSSASSQGPTNPICAVLMGCTALSRTVT